jgi:hypothetical protein
MTAEFIISARRLDLAELTGKHPKPRKKAVTDPIAAVDKDVAHEVFINSAWMTPHAYAMPRLRKHSIKPPASDMSIPLIEIRVIGSDRLTSRDDPAIASFGEGAELNHVSRWLLGYA